MGTKELGCGHRSGGRCGTQTARGKGAARQVRACVGCVCGGGVTAQNVHVVKQTGQKNKVVEYHHPEEMGKVSVCARHGGAVGRWGGARHAAPRTLQVPARRWVKVRRRPLSIESPWNKKETLSTHIKQCHRRVGVCQRPPTAL